MRYWIDGLACAAVAAVFLTAAGLGSAAALALSSFPAQATPAPASHSATSPGTPPATITTAGPRGTVLSVEARIADRDKRLFIR